MAVSPKVGDYDPHAGSEFVDLWPPHGTVKRMPMDEYQRSAFASHEIPQVGALVFDGLGGDAGGGHAPTLGEPGKKGSGSTQREPGDGQLPAFEYLTGTGSADPEFNSAGKERDRFPQPLTNSPTGSGAAQPDYADV